MTTLASGLGYGTSSSDPTGAMGLPSGANVGNNTYVYAATHDNAGRLTAVALRTAGGAGRFRSAPSYDAVGNVTSVATTFNGTSTDNQAFCYDELNRLTWASSQTGTGPNTCASNTAGTLGGSALYTASYAYDVMDRLTSGPLGSYTYGDSGHLHAATAVGSGYTASYDAAGNMVCRAPTSSTSCTSVPQTGAQYSYDTERRMVHWQNAPGSGVTPYTDEGYDGEGNRVAEVYHTSLTAYTTFSLAGGLVWQTLKQQPTPRTVRMRCGMARASSSRSRCQRMYTSTVRVSPVTTVASNLPDDRHVPGPFSWEGASGRHRADYRLRKV